LTFPGKLGNVELPSRMFFGTDNSTSSGSRFQHQPVVGKGPSALQRPSGFDQDCCGCLSVGRTFGVGGRCGLSSQHHLPELMVPSPKKTWIPSSSPVVKSTASPELPPPTPDPEADYQAELQAVRQQAEAMQDAPAHVRRDRFLVLEAVRVHGAALRFVDAEFRKDRGVVLEAVRSNGLALEFAAEELRGDRNVVVEAVRETGWALQFASPLLCEDTALQAESDWRTGGY